MSDSKLQSDLAPTPETAPDGAIISPDTRRSQRIPPNQSRTKKWPVLDTGIHPKPLAPEDFTLNLDGLVEEPISLTWDDLKALPTTKVFADMHCVTRWSRLGNVWEGVRTRDLLSRVTLQPNARYVLAHGRDVVTFFRGGSESWNTNLPLEYFLHEDCLLAWSHDGEPLDNEHGGPVRLVIPSLYAWKSAKWLCGLTFLAEDRLGYWERGGYHALGDPWREQRFRFSDDD